ncbi:MAG TPA: hypothetical protein DEQ47_15650 [Solibacterales bacterium]|nr:hypothetical protein [Bryobacterales bacterium]
MNIKTAGALAAVVLALGGTSADSAERELREFAGKWNRGHFDKGELDDSMASIQHVADNNRMPSGNRGALIGV